MKFRMLFVTLAFLSVAPCIAAAQTTGPRVSVAAAVGTHLRGGGDNQSVALGFAPNARLELLVSGERSHLPMTTEGTGVTRGGTTSFVSGEIRVSPFTASRVSPYLLVSAGRGVSRPNVNEQFPDRVTNDVWMFFGGAGVRVALSEHFNLFADVRAGTRHERDTVGLLLPVRAGIALRF